MKSTSILKVLLFSMVMLVVAGATYGKSVYYRGVVLGEDHKPVSGVFPMTFSLYKSAKSKRPVWKESMWVAVDRGGYIVELGTKKRLPAGKLSNYYIGISIKGLGELVREPFHPTAVATKNEPDVKLPAIPQKQSPVVQENGTSYADRAGFAAEAAHAKDSDRLGGLTLDEVLQKLKQAQQEMGGGIKIGSTRKYGNRIGGPGGTADYNEQCPEGYVMVGVRGAYGLYVDSMQIVCAPISAK